MTSCPEKFNKQFTELIIIQYRQKILLKLQEFSKTSFPKLGFHGHILEGKGGAYVRSRDRSGKVETAGQAVPDQRVGTTRCSFLEK